MDFIQNIQKFFQIPTNLSKDSFIKYSQSPASASQTPETKQIAAATNTDLPKLSYQFYQMLASKVQTPYTGYIHYGCNGRENDPNVTLMENWEVFGYVTTNLYIFSKIHNGNFDAELVLENYPISKSHKPIFVCFPLKTDLTVTQNTINTILNNAEPSIDIDLSEITKSVAKIAKYYETPETKIIVIQTPIPVAADFTGLNGRPPIGGGFLDDIFSTNLATNIRKIPILQSGEQYPIQKFYTIEDPPTKYWNLVEGLSMSDPGYNYFWMECDNVDVDYTNEIPTYTISAGADNITLKEQTLNYVLSMIWLIVAIVGMVIITPIVFSLLGRILIAKYSDHKNQLTYLNNLEGFLSQILFIPGIILTSVGVSKQVKCSNDDDTCTAAANNIILPGAIFICLWFLFISSMFVYKLFGYDFFGGGIFKYATDEIGLLQLINPVAITVIGEFL